MKNRQKAILSAAALTIGLSLGACGKKEEAKGPAEKAGAAIGQAIDKAAEQTGQAMEKAGEAIKDAADKVKDTKK